MSNIIHFESDYMAGAHPRVMSALGLTNLIMTPGYGADEFTKSAIDRIRRECCAPEHDVWLLVGGTQTNATVIHSLLRPYHGVLAADSAHINVHESGAIENGGHKVLTLPQSQGKVTAHDVQSYLDNFYADDTWPHMVIPGMLYITHPTEFGALYTLEELTALSYVCHKAGIPFYLDGARLAYGLGALPEVSLSQIASLCDVFYIGGTKCGALMGEAVVARKGLLPHFFTSIKQHGALLAKGRLLGVQFGQLFTDGLYYTIGREAVSLAMKLRDGFVAAGAKLHVDSPTNQQFFELPNEVIDRLLPHLGFEYWGPRGTETSVVRFVTSWATTSTQVDEAISLMRDAFSSL